MVMPLVDSLEMHGIGVNGLGSAIRLYMNMSYTAGHPTKL